MQRSSAGYKFLHLIMSFRLFYIFISINISARVFKVSVMAGRSISDFIFNVCNAMNHQFTTKDPKILATI